MRSTSSMKPPNSTDSLRWRKFSTGCLSSCIMRTLSDSSLAIASSTSSRACQTACLQHRSSSQLRQERDQALREIPASWSPSNESTTTYPPISTSIMTENGQDRQTVGTCRSTHLIKWLIGTMFSSSGALPQPEPHSMQA